MPNASDVFDAITTDDHIGVVDNIAAMIQAKAQEMVHRLAYGEWDQGVAIEEPDQFDQFEADRDAAIAAEEVSDEETE